MSLRGAWRRFKTDLEQSRRFESDVHAASDAEYAERFGRYGSDEERAAFHRDFRKCVLDDQRARDAVFIAHLREQTELIDDELAQLKRRIGDMIPALEKAKSEGTNLTAVVRTALRDYVEEENDGTRA